MATIDSGGIALSGDEAGEGTPVVLLHGLTATRRYVVMGSRLLERSGHRVIGYDARGHGRSAPAPAPDAYRYEDLADDLGAVLDEFGIHRAVLAGASMGAHTALRFALDHPQRVAGLCVVTPAHDPDEDEPAGRIERWDALSAALRERGVEGFVEAYCEDGVADERWRETIVAVLRQRLSAHEHPDAVADALRTVPRSSPFGRIADLARIDAPTVVIASRDEADPGHPYDVGSRYAQAIPGARLLSEEEGESPLAWQGGRVSKAIAEVAADAEL